METAYKLNLEQMIKLTRKVDDEDWKLNPVYRVTNQEKVKAGCHNLEKEILAKKYNGEIVTQEDGIFKISIYYFLDSDNGSIASISIKNEGILLGEQVCGSIRNSEGFSDLEKRYKEIKNVQEDPDAIKRRVPYLAALELIEE